MSNGNAYLQDEIPGCNLKRKLSHGRACPKGRVIEDWHAHGKLRWSLHRFRGGPQSGCHGHVLFHPVLHEVEALTGMAHGEVIHPAP